MENTEEDEPWGLGDSLMFHVQVIVLTLQKLHFQQLTQNLRHPGPPQHILDQFHHPDMSHKTQMNGFLNQTYEKNITNMQWHLR